MVENTPQWIRQTELLQAQLQKINVSLDVEPVNPADAYSRIVQKKTNWTHTRWAQRADPNGLLYILFHSKGNANTTGYSNPKVDELLDQASAIYEVERRRPLYYQADRLITDDVPYVFLNYTAEFAVIGRKVQNWSWIPDLIPRPATSLEKRPRWRRGGGSPAPRAPRGAEARVGLDPPPHTAAWASPSSS